MKDKIDFDKNGGLVPAIIQDADSRQVLMLGYMNEEALDKTRKSGKVTFYSRSKNRLWVKGEESGNFLNLINIKEDCDKDTLLISAKPEGSVCHTGSHSCFGDEEFNLKTLEKDIEKRADADPKESYTALLISGGVDKISDKIIEEAGEVVQAAEKETKQRLREESADLLYHLIVLLKAKKVSLNDVENELKSRRGKRSKSLN
ncbi:MAG TPA: bifunctional phosphoribosyl-AMP cyclohydrolase/phosphoribosyl-ATP diphosphatase HisIE [Candidatus Saccharimonadales bacterium]|nr:bifunctional phosphoribosyl-AMP cyclohydrolase/phosphoribosyl-ATP diphosphatase HisIE [Candidatus Saccharimonadales bacterium]